MPSNKFEKYNILQVNRTEITGAEYNPRKISESAKKKLKRGMKTFGLLAPIIVNRLTMNVVSGHQKLAIMDEDHKYPENDYTLTVAMVELSEEDEVKANVLLNNQSAQGEWDMTALQSIVDLFPKIDIEKDFGFDKSDIMVMFGLDYGKTEEAKVVEQKTQEFSKDDFRAMKKEQREKAKEENEENGSYHLNDNDYAVTFVFPNNREKRKFMTKIKKPEKETHVKSTVLWDIYNKVFNLSDF